MKNPIQPLAKDEHGTLRFKANAIVRHLLDTHPSCDLNSLACMDFTDDDRQQFAQLIGYSLSGYGELCSYVDDEAYNTAANMADGLDERDSRIAALEQKLADIRGAVDMMREPMARMLEMHPDDLKAYPDHIQHAAETRDSDAELLAKYGLSAKSMIDNYLSKPFDPADLSDTPPSPAKE